MCVKKKKKNDLKKKSKNNNNKGPSAVFSPARRIVYTLLATGARAAAPFAEVGTHNILCKCAAAGWENKRRVKKKKERKKGLQECQLI